ncbi:glycoside hydrolase family 97 catalytic domain-containing protein [Paenibacillus gorillae]|uniref:glycoside hydrolase family 97 catalytic domain-containing protein n=1 Tax=Paenibacillus gorillae TaxID=1243662 RepID=UPI0004BBCA16|nr:glycoside hydrolase family 97 catalytic domain-containing protein [Paenibacillus gorillae]
MWKLYSPNNAVSFTVFESSEKELGYAVERNGKAVIEQSKLGFESDLENFTRGFRFVKEARAVVDETYSIPAGKKAVYENHANEMTLEFECGAYTFVLCARAYDDGAAFRYQVLSNEEKPMKVLREATNFTLSEAYNDLWLQHWVSSYEGTYDRTGWEDKEGRDYGMPSLFHADNGGWVMLTEAEVYNTDGSYCSCHLRGAGNRTMSLEFAPEEMGGPLSCKLPFSSPWRVIVATDDLNELVNTTINYNLNPPSVMEDTSWIKPGRCLWGWWEYMNSAQLYTEQKRFVDFAAGVGFEGLTVDADWDITWLKELCDYAHSKGIVVWLWSAMQYIDTPEKAQEKIPLWASCGVDGLKVDFFQNDSQHTMWQYEMIANLMTEHRLMINFHGATKCMGEGRTWPNFMTAEGILGLEHYMWSGLPDANHNCTVPFTRNVVGPMDYTPTGFSNKNRNTTLGHQMALSVVYESGAAHIAASIYYLEAWKGTDFLRRMKPVYDEVKVLSGFPGHHAAIMRRSQGDWLIGCITDEAMILRLKMDFLPEGEFEADIYEDDSSGELMKVKRIKVTSADVIELPLLKSGGAGIYITKEISELPKGICSGYMSEARTEYLALAGQTLQGSEPVVYENEQEAVLLNGSIVFAVETTDTPQTIRLFYAAQEPWTLRVSDGINKVEMEMPQSGSNKIFLTKDVVFPFAGGESALFFERIGGAVPALERFHIIDNIPQKELYVPVGKGSLSGGAELVLDAAGAEKATGLGNGGELKFDRVRVPKDGYYLMRFDYCAGESRDLSIELNGGAHTYRTNLHNTAGWGFPRWDIKDQREIRIWMQAGNNTFRLYNDEGRAAHIYGFVIIADEY